MEKEGSGVKNTGVWLGPWGKEVVDSLKEVKKEVVRKILNYKDVRIRRDRKHSQQLLNT